MLELKEYWTAVQSVVCVHCIDSDGRGRCRLASNAPCALSAHFPSVVDSILSMQSDGLDPYVNALREKVCSVCEHGETDGTCTVRNEIECGLDRYFPMVVEAIERVEMNSTMVAATGRR